VSEVVIIMTGHFIVTALIVTGSFIVTGHVDEQRAKPFAGGCRAEGDLDCAFGVRLQRPAIVAVAEAGSRAHVDDRAGPAALIAEGYLVVRTGAADWLFSKVNKGRVSVQS
jgi:hypothetical protein